MYVNESMDIKYHKWSKSDAKRFFQSCRNHLNVIEPQLYFPIMSLFFYTHNTPYSHRVIDFKRDHYVKEILSQTPLKPYTSNSLVECVVNEKNVIQTRTLFAKAIPLLDPIHYLLNNYCISHHRNPLLPSNYNFNTISKINDMNNMGYIDVFFSFIASQITLKQKNPSFPRYYGAFTCLGSYKHDITEDIHELKHHDGFKSILPMIDIDRFDFESGSESDSESEEEDYIATFQKFPMIYQCIEALEGTLEDIIQQELSLPLLKSCLFQITFALIYLQKHYYFTHNDLHINNVMYQSTDRPFLYYKYNNQYFKIPTYGKLFKIIDFGRSIFTFRKKTYMNDVFSKYGEAEGQYTHPPQVSFLKQDITKPVYPSYHFDLCRLAITMIDEIRYNHDETLENDDDYQDFLDYLKYLVTDTQGVRLDKLEDNFDLYVRISRDACHCLPSDVIQSSFFKEFRVKKKVFPKKTYYTT